MSETEMDVVKTCAKCQEIKLISEFTRNSQNLDKHCNFCRTCDSQRRKKLRQDNLEEVKLKERQYYKENREMILTTKKCWAKVNRNKINKVKQKHFIKHRKSVLEQKRRWREKNINRIREQERERRRHKIKLDPLYRCRVAIGKLITISIKGKGYKKNTKTEQILGCPIKEFKTYLADRFKPGMDWLNHGEWHIDHIKPVSLAETKEEVLKLNHYSNFQPLWAEDNLRKGAKYGIN